MFTVFLGSSLDGYGNKSTKPKLKRPKAYQYGGRFLSSTYSSLFAIPSIAQLNRAEDCRVNEVVLRSLVLNQLEENFIIFFFCCVFDKNIISFVKTRATRDEHHGRH